MLLHHSSGIGSICMICLNIAFKDALPKYSLTSTWMSSGATAFPLFIAFTTSSSLIHSTCVSSLSVALLSLFSHFPHSPPVQNRLLFPLISLLSVSTCPSLSFTSLSSHHTFLDLTHSFSLILVYLFAPTLCLLPPNSFNFHWDVFSTSFSVCLKFRPTHHHLMLFSYCSLQSYKFCNYFLLHKISSNCVCNPPLV